MARAEGPATTIRERLGWDVTPELYAKIRRLWIDHSKAEDGRDLGGLIATLSEDCVYEIVPTGERWEGHAGARSFYMSFLSAFPDVRFDLKDIVIGPQGVIEIATMRGTQRGAWQGQAATGRKADLDIIIHFPWDPSRIGSPASASTTTPVLSRVSSVPSGTSP